MKLSDFDYYLPKDLIAQESVKPRDHSRLLVLRRIGCQIEHRHFYELVDYLKAGDVLVLNNSKVFPARLLGRKEGTGGRVEVFLLRPVHGQCWQCLLGGRGCQIGLKIIFRFGLKAEVIKNNGDGTWDVKFNRPKPEMRQIVNRIGQVPLPPYIKRKSAESQKRKDRESYQTVYADEKKVGSVAAPTAGFHFTKRLIRKLKDKGVQFEFITLHVGLGTFAPVKVHDITKHKMHSEWVEVAAKTIKNIIKAKEEGRRIIAVGTTSVRTLEAIAGHILNPQTKVSPHKFQGWVDIFIYPPYRFKLVDAMITNFHLPKSTLLMLVNAFAGRKCIDKSYQCAIKEKYRFYSYGDAMFIY
jgi:S-adenosylmethionine:tRNA ribosyltransferase-isomerase